MKIEDVPEGQCQEASVLSKEDYIPCGAPAVFMVIQKDEARLRMCATCADHNVNNRGAKLDGEYLPPAGEKESSPAAVDFESMVGDAPTEDTLERLSGMAHLQMELEDQLAELSLIVKEKTAKLTELSESLIPSVLDETGLSEIRLADGTKVIVKETLRVTTAGKYRDVIQAWLVEKGHDDIIKDTVTAQFSKGEGERAAALVAAAAEFTQVVDRKRTVAPGTFGALLRELLEDGVEVPLDEFGAFFQRQTKLDRAL